MEQSCAPTLTDEIGLPAVTPQTILGLGRPIHVLLVEDDAESAELVKDRLTDKGDQSFRVEWTPNLVEAMIRLALPGIDVVLLDLGLPELSGYKSFSAIEAAAGYKLPVVIFTSDDRRVSKDLTLGLGAAEYLIKDKSTPAELRQALRNAFLRQRPEMSTVPEG